MQDLGGRKRYLGRLLATARTRAVAAVAVGLVLGGLWVPWTGVQPAGAASYGPSFCSGYRWDVKTGQDPQASQVNLTSATPTTGVPHAMASSGTNPSGSK